MKPGKRTIRSKIMIGFCLLCAFCMTVSLLWLQAFHRKNSLQYLKANLTELGKTAVSQMESHFGEMEQVAAMILQEEQFSILAKDFEDNPDEEKARNALKLLMSRIYRHYDQIRRVAVLLTDGSVVSTGNLNTDENEVRKLLSYVQNRVIHVDTGLYYPVCRDYLDRNSESSVFTYIAPVLREQSICGYLLVQQNLIYDENALTLSLDRCPVDTIIVCQDRDVLYTSCDSQEKTKKYVSFCSEYSNDKENETNLFNIIISDHRFMKYIFVLPKSITSFRLRGYYITFSGSLILFFALAAVFILFFVGQITKPMREIASHMAAWNIVDDSTRELHINTKDYESEVLYQTYKEMMNRQKDIVEVSRKLEDMQERTLFSVLQSEISPHFLFNTLGGIAEKCEEGGAFDAAGSCYDLADLLRYASGNPSDEVMLQQEINNLNAYLHLMQLRLQNRLQFIVEVAERSGFLYIPKMTLQPIVENAIQYSIMKNDCAVISVSTCYEADRIHIIIKDNGIGMDADAIDKVRKRYERVSDSKEFQEVLESIQIGNMGLSGTLIRLKLFYKDAFEYEIENGNKGTSIIMKIRYQNYM